MIKVWLVLPRYIGYLWRYTNVQQSFCYG